MPLPEVLWEEPLEEAAGTWLLIIGRLRGEPDATVRIEAPREKALDLRNRLEGALQALKEP